MRISRFAFLLILVAAAVGLTGCFQPAGSGSDPTPNTGQVLVPPSPTSGIPTIAPVTNTPFVVPSPTTAQQTLVPPTAVVAVVASPTVESLAVQSTEVGAPYLTLTAYSAQQVTSTPLPPPTLAPPTLALPTATPFVMPSITPIPPATLTDREAEAEQIYAQATMTAEFRMTATATAMGILPPTATLVPTGFPTLQPTIGPSPTLDPAVACVHVVRRGDTMYSIAREYDMSMDEIVAANGISNPALLSLGQELVIPGCGATEQPAVAATVTLPPTLAPDGECVQDEFYVQPGDNLYRIALSYGVSLNALKQANNIINIHNITAGETLIIPCR